MNAEKLKGMKVLDNDGVQIGKVSDLGIDCEQFKIRNILISTGGIFSKKYFTADIDEINKINSNIHLKSSKEEQNIATPIEVSSPEDYFFKNFQYRVVKTNEEPLLGLIKDIIFDLKNDLTFDVVIEKLVGGPLGKPSFTASLEDFSNVDILMTLKLDKNEIKERLK
jgi:sporulation protein YlmC with PRC-barrel domain